MKALNIKYRKYFGNRTFVISIVLAFLMLILSLFINFYAGTYATERASNYVNDIVLSNIPVFDVDLLFVYAPLILWLFVASLIFYEPRKIPFVIKSIALFNVIRSIFITLTHIGPFPDQIAFNANSSIWIGKFFFGGDLFFSAHTGLPFLMALVFWDSKTLRYIFIGCAIFFGIIVLLGHLHYSIDVASAFFITFTIYHIAKTIFKKDKLLFDGKISPGESLTS